MTHQLTLRTDASTRTAAVAESADGRLTITLDGRAEPIVAVSLGAGAWRVDVDGTAHVLYTAGPRTDRWVWWQGEAYRAEVLTGGLPARRGARGHVHQSLTAPMPATVLKVLVAPGASVKKGDTVVLVEAMKMELPIRAPGDATVTAVNCREGDIVPPDRVLVELE